MNRKQFLSTATLLLATTVAGCGGGGNDNNDQGDRIDNQGGNASADLSRLTVQPFHYDSAFISGGTRFLLSWPSVGDAPRTTQVALYRFLEARGEEIREDFREDIRIAGAGNAAWTVRKQSDLFPGGVFFLDVSTNLDRRRYAFIVEGGRSVKTEEPTRGVDINTGGSGALSNMTLRWNGDAIGPVGIPTNNSFVLQFPSEGSAPPRISVRLRRYKERRGSDGPSANEQEIEVSHDGGTGTWIVRRRDNFALERGATYILEINADGEPRQRNYTFLTEG